mgnify:CR=1 FL=1
MEPDVDDPGKATERRSQRKRKQKETYSPDRHKHEGEKKKTKVQKSNVNRAYDVLPTGNLVNFWIFIV